MEKFPELELSYINLYKFEKEVEKYINLNYGENTYENVYYTQEFNKEIENVQNGIIKHNTWNQFAQTYNRLLQKYVDESYKVKQKIGSKKTLKLIDEIKNDLNRSTHNNEIIDDLIQSFGLYY